MMGLFMDFLRSPWSIWLQRDQVCSDKSVCNGVNWSYKTLCWNLFWAGRYCSHNELVSTCHVQIHVRSPYCLHKFGHICHWCIYAIGQCHNQNLSYMILLNFKHIYWLQSSTKFVYFLLSYRKVASSRLVYYSILDHFVQRSQYIRIKVPPHKQSENPWMCY